MSHGTFLDDDPQAIEAAEHAEAEERQKAAALTPHQFAVGAIEFEALARQLVAKGIGFGQTRRGFLTTLARTWDEYLPAYKVLRKEAPPWLPPAVEVRQTFAAATDPDKVFVRFKDDLEAAAAARATGCPVCGNTEAHQAPDGHIYQPPKEPPT